jgi:hypothetical protein
MRIWLPTGVLAAEQLVLRTVSPITHTALPARSSISVKIAAGGDLPVAGRETSRRCCR